MWTERDVNVALALMTPCQVAAYRERAVGTADERYRLAVGILMGGGYVDID